MGGPISRDPEGDNQMPVRIRFYTYVHLPRIGFCRLMTEGIRHEVLVAADDPQVVEILSSALEEKGYRVRRAYDGLSALEEIERSAPDLVVADLVMSRLGGVDLARQLLARPEPIPVVLMSAVYRGSPEVEGVLVRNPFDVGLLLSTVAEAFGSRAGDGQHS
jgi:CheY-like chemotaxis protein